MSILLVFELVGTIAFSVSGAIIALQKKMDLFGVIILGLTTAVGGGVLRDIILGNTPPVTFQKPIYAVTAIISATIVFYLPARSHTKQQKIVFDSVMLIMDSLGLGIFTVMGIQIAYASCTDARIFLLIFVGVITGVGGGVLRDVFAGNMPYIFVKHFYACASLLGAFCCILLWNHLGKMYAMLIGAVTTILLRILAAHYHWSLPKSNSDK